MVVTYVVYQNYLWLTGGKNDALRLRAENYRMNSVSENTRKARDSQWRRYLSACEEFEWTPMPCSVEQACKYVTLLSDGLSFSTIMTYYQSVIFKHVCCGLEPVRASNSVLRSTLNGIKRSQGLGEKGKDPMFPSHLKRIYNVLHVNVHVELLVFLAALLMFRSLLRVSHVVTSDHTLCRRDVLFNNKGCLLRVRSSKNTSGKGNERYIPITWAPDASMCAARGLKALLESSPGQPDYPLFSSGDASGLSYSTFHKVFKSLISRAGLIGDFASHSLRRGGATYMSMVGCTVLQVKDRGGWSSDCVYRYIKPPISHKVKIDEKFVSRV